MSSPNESAESGRRVTVFEFVGGRAALLDFLRHFYADVRQDTLIGPIFNAQIHDWPAHLEKIADFWALQTGGPSGYRGGFGAAHLPLGLEETHFRRWLMLWELNCKSRLEPAAADWFIARAQELAGNLRRLLGGRSGLQIDGRLAP
jgi:hemoglobin